MLPKKYSEDNQHVMIRMKYLVAAATLSLMLSGCSGNKEILPDASPSELYTVGQEKLQDGNYKGAITQLETLDNRFPFGPYSQQVQLDLIYAYYKAGDLQMALASIDRFMRLNPTHPNIDYVLYMRGLTAQALDDNMLQSFFGIDRATRETTSMKTAFSNFQSLVRAFPNSPYSQDAVARMAYIKDSLARHELEIAKFYAKRDAWVAVSNRVVGMLQQYPDAKATYEGLFLMKEAYEKMGLQQLANQTQQVIDANKDKQFADVKKPEESDLTQPVKK